ncbi:MAG: polyprenol monophosphomannose synthase [Candidatus Omnitrophica bacterium]|nr:polyprenol monophosphomannose synthase [Candidatus Omnitrophota bacterium]
MTKPKLSLIIPTYNERENLPELVRRIHTSLKEIEYQLIIVDDNSPDETGILAEKLAKKYPIMVIHRKKRGLASAIVDGFRNAKSELLCVMDADLQHPPEKIIDLLKKVKNVDLVIASRYINRSSVKGLNLWRRITSEIAKALAQAFFPSIRRIKDPLSGFFILKKNVINKIELKAIGYKILLEILVKGRYKNVVEIPYIFGKRKMGKNKLSFVEYLNYLKCLFILKFNR